MTAALAEEAEAGVAGFGGCWRLMAARAASRLGPPRAARMPEGIRAGVGVEAGLLLEAGRTVVREVVEAEEEAGGVQTCEVSNRWFVQ